MVTQSSILAWRIPWTGEPGGLQSMRSHSVDMTEHTHAHTHTHTHTHTQTVAVFVIQVLSHVQLLGALQTAASQASLSLTISQNLLKHMV